MTSMSQPKSFHYQTTMRWKESNSDSTNSSSNNNTNEDNNEKKEKKSTANENTQFNQLVRAAGITLLSGLALWYIFNKDELEIWGLQKMPTNSIQRTRTKSVGRPLVGGSFTLVQSKDGKPVTDSSYRGKCMLLYFGFCNCPDICPTEMEKFSKQVLPELSEEEQARLSTLFVSVDPFRDTCDAIEDFLLDFEGYEGLTGTPGQIKQICHKFRIYYTLPDIGDDDYLFETDYPVDHSAYTYLLDEYGRLAALYYQDQPAGDIVKSIKNYMNHGITEFD